MPEELLEEIAELLKAGASQETIQILITGYWEQVRQLHIIVASFFGFVFAIAGVVTAWWKYRDSKS